MHTALEQRWRRMCLRMPAWSHAADALDSTGRQGMCTMSTVVVYDWHSARGGGHLSRRPKCRGAVGLECRSGMRRACEPAGTAGNVAASAQATASEAEPCAALTGTYWGVFVPASRRAMSVRRGVILRSPFCRCSGRRRAREEVGDPAQAPDAWAAQAAAWNHPRCMIILMIRLLPLMVIITVIRIGIDLLLRADIMIGLLILITIVMIMSCVVSSSDSSLSQAVSAEQR